jgi:hypothetical protein
MFVEPGAGGTAMLAPLMLTLPMAWLSKPKRSPD